jgi:hypothetical protein
MSFFDRFQGVFFNPQPVFKALAEKPVWKDALIVLLIVMAAFSYITAPISQKDALNAFKDNIKLQDKMGKEAFDKMIQGMENPSTTGTIIRSVLNPVLMLVGWLIAGLIVLVLGRLVSTEGAFLPIFAAVLHANFIDKIFGTLVRLILIMTRKSVMQTSTSLALLMPGAEFTSTPFIILSQFDFFQLWMFGVLGLGLAQIFKVSVAKGMVISYGFWALKSIVFVALGFLSRSFLG